MTWPGLKPVDLSHEAANTNSIVFDMTWPGLKPVIYHTKQQTPIL